ncbi:MAG: prolyl oligopeptidase family serine peptidase [Hyphomonadaceae bacterium]
MSLSNGGNAATVREYDLATRSASRRFRDPEAKPQELWVDKDTLLIATDWGEENGQATLTTSGYPYVAKLWKRGAPLETAKTMFRGEIGDVAAGPFAIENEFGRRWYGASRAETFFTASNFLFPEDDNGALTGGDPIRLPIPLKSSPQGVFGDMLYLTLEEDWTPEGQPAFKSGDLVAFAWGEFLHTKKLPEVSLVLRPTARQAIQDVSISRAGLLITLSDNVAVKVLQLSGKPGAWTLKDVGLPPAGSAEVIFADSEEVTAYLGYESFLSPDTLYQYDTVSHDLSAIKSLPAWFDAGPYEVQQFEAASKDGTKVPYFVVHAKGMKLDGSNPALLYGYGGFQVSMTPGYSGSIGKLWLDQGGVYVLANIRGGGEFGPAWHQAGLKTKRQVVYDDFIAVAEDLISRKITSPKKLGAMGGSNGGLLMGVMFTQRPDLFNAIVCQVPLLDMLRYHLLLAGASWMDEYGDPDVPEERAFLEKLSPYHNVDPAQTYPEIYFETSTKDDRVHPGHARKMAKRLEDLGKPFLYYENTDGGHSAAANQRETARRMALEYTYLARKLMDGK